MSRHVVSLKILILSVSQVTYSLRNSQTLPICEVWVTLIWCHVFNWETSDGVTESTVSISSVGSVASSIIGDECPTSSLGTEFTDKLEGSFSKNDAVLVAL